MTTCATCGTRLTRPSKARVALHADEHARVYCLRHAPAQAESAYQPSTLPTASVIPLEEGQA